ncbi:hypothetical protein [Phyllobacterium lublinensis]|uniref:hypothetical protein n=1 Tax=Phyllobacterium lublinensis TaxID=2875708 RepID=UPI001CCA44B7|nr:hypothetical protein [Phyllobacterium sp. 2063]MBZ9657014.1 hypothetical protein [Phyllobacterium sp. 2063]
MRNLALAVITATVVLGGCTLPTVSGTPMVAPDSIFEAPMVRLTEKGVTLRKVNQPVYCRGEVAGLYGTRPQYVKVNPPVKQAHGLTTIEGEVDRGSEGITKFACRYDAKGTFIGVKLQE